MPLPLPGSCLSVWLSRYVRSTVVPSKHIDTCISGDILPAQGSSPRAFPFRMKRSRVTQRISTEDPASSGGALWFRPSSLRTRLAPVLLAGRDARAPDSPAQHKHEHGPGWGCVLPAATATASAGGGEAAIRRDERPSMWPRKGAARADGHGAGSLGRGGYDVRREPQVSSRWGVSRVLCDVPDRVGDALWRVKQADATMIGPSSSSPSFPARTKGSSAGWTMTRICPPPCWCIRDTYGVYVSDKPLL